MWIAFTDRFDVSGRKDQYHRKPIGLARCFAGAKRIFARRRWEGRHSAGARRSRQNGGAFQPNSEWGLDRAYWQADSKRHQYWYWRFRPRTGDGLRGAQALLRPKHDVS